MLKIKREDEVVVITGRDKGKRGKVIKVLSNGRLLVAGVNMVKKHQRGNPQAGVEGGILEREASIDASNVAIWNAKAGRADRVGFKIQEDGSKVRIFKSDSSVIGA